MPSWLSSKCFPLQRRTPVLLVTFVTVLVVAPIIVQNLPKSRARRDIYRWLRDVWRGRKHDIYQDALEEARYWAAAERYGRRLRTSDARFAGRRIEQPKIPAVTYYTPALLPWYRQRKPRSPEYFLSTRAFCKWHRMVFPGP
ncbi:hypothetical protein B0H10DRAFT_2040593 [Mycena sp. CBHHK59/15]|nr:hypothetical protein B0H10DRAFT_2040593 [Mycena sp. CBHHK59/15]